VFFTGGTTEIQQNIAKDQSRYIKSSLKQSSYLPTNTVGSREQSATASPTPNSSNSKAHLPGRISVAYAEIEALTNEKISIARQIVELLTRTRARLDGDLSKVRILQGESPEDIRPSVSPNVAHQLTLSSPYGTKRFVGSDTAVIGSGVSPVIQIGESLRTAAGVGKSDTTHSMSTSGSGYNKSKSHFSPLLQGVGKNHRLAGTEILTPVPPVLISY
jgi:chromatin modification-related protein YNG2